MNQLTTFHRIAFWYAWKGFRAPQYLWGLVRLATRVASPSKVLLPNGFPMIVDERDWTSKTIYEGTYERSLLHFLNSLELSELVIDVGANVGVTLWHCLKNSSLNVQYLAFEPSSQCSDGLQLTTSKIDRNGSVHECALGDRNELRTIFGINNAAHSGGASLIQHSGLGANSEEIQVRTLDSVLNELNLESSVSMLKIDTEGFEAQVIIGSSLLLASQKIEMIIMEVSPNFGDVRYLKEVHKLLGEGYLWFSLDETGFIKRRPFLRRITLEQSIESSVQWNLVLIRADIFKIYCSKRHKYIKKSN